MSDQFKPQEDQLNNNLQNSPENNVEDNQNQIVGNSLDNHHNYLDQTSQVVDDNVQDDNDADIPHDAVGFDEADLNQANLDDLGNLDEETAAEVTPVIDNRPINRGENVPEMEQQEVGGTALGWTALILSIMALFFFPVLLGSAGAITGFFAYRNGARSLGMWSIAIGIFALVMGLFFIPYFMNRA